MSFMHAKIVKDSISEAGRRITTFELKYPRIIHAELKTHRILSTNSASSRAIPVKRMIQGVIEETFIPWHWGANQPGMQARQEIGETAKDLARSIWVASANEAIHTARRLADLGLHKQIVNRVLEPYQYITTLVTGTEFNHFLALRNDDEAEDHFHDLAFMVKGELGRSTPTLLPVGGWHLPYIDEDDRDFVWMHKGGVDGDLTEMQALLVKLCVARCARVSYLTHDKKRPSLEEDLALYERLTSHWPIHASPLEHAAYALSDANEQSGNFKGWFQHRKQLQKEFVPG